MKCKLVFLVFCFAFFSFGYGQNYSIKDRLNTKLSISCNRTNEFGGDYFVELDRPLHPIRFRFNVRAECNYGVTNWLELGGYLGYIRYENMYYSRIRKKDFDKVAFAPIFGVNANVHLLPFFVKNKDCRWEWYLTAKYGGTYLINHIAFRSQGISFISSNPNVQVDEIICSDKRYRQVFGVGMGGGMYFKNVWGLYTEIMAGQYSYFPEICPVYWTARVGIEFKFYSKQNKNKAKNKNNEILPQHIEIQVK